MATGVTSNLAVEVPPPSVPPTNHPPHPIQVINPPDHTSFHHHSNVTGQQVEGTSHSIHVYHPGSRYENTSLLYVLMGEVVSQFLPLMGCACKLQVIQWLVHSAMLNNALRCVAFASALVEMQRDARIDSDPILACDR